MLEITSDAGRRFRVRCIRKGDRYGLNGCLTHDQKDPVIEFTDVTAPGESGLLANETFVARYPAKLLLLRSADAPLWLFGENVAWRLGPGQLAQVMEWLKAGCPG